MVDVVFGGCRLNNTDAGSVFCNVLRYGAWLGGEAILADIGQGQRLIHRRQANGKNNYTYQN